MNNESVRTQGTERPEFSGLIREHHRRLMGYAFSICKNEDAAKDIVQESFVVAWQNIDKFDVTRDFGAWMRGIIRNKVKEWSRGLDLVAMDNELLDVLENQHRSWDSESADRGESQFTKLGECIKTLPDLLNQSIHLFYFQKLSGAEVASRLGADPATIRKRLERARAQLRNCMEQHSTNNQK